VPLQVWSGPQGSRKLRFPDYNQCYMDSLHFNIYSPHYRHGTWTAYTSTFTLHTTAMLHGQPTLQHLLSTLPPCYMVSLHFNIYSPQYRHVTWTAYTSTFTLHITAMLHEQPTLQHLLSTIPPCYMYRKDENKS
jgi:hypothetical protein